MRPRFSILVPTYNIQKFIRETIDAVLSQTFTDFELIVIDDGSTDRTMEVLKSYSDRIKIGQQTNAGPEEARRKAAKMARGEYLVLLDHDDLLLPWALATYNRIIHEFDAPSLIIGKLKWFQDGTSPVPENYAYEEIGVFKFDDYLIKDVTAPLSCSNVVVRRSVFEQSGALQSTYKAFPMDTYHYVLLFGAFGPCVILQMPYTVGYRQHKNNTTLNHEFMIRGLMSVVEAERLGLHGRTDRRVDRYACLGEILIWWLVKGLKHGKIRVSIETLLNTVPMLLAGGIRRGTRAFRRRPTLLRLT